MSKVFNQEFGFVHYGDEVMKVKVADVQVAIFQVTHRDIAVPNYDEDGIFIGTSPLVTHSFLFGARDIEGDKALLQVVRFDGTSKIRIVKGVTFGWNFNHTMRKIDDRDSIKLIYNGKRNEG